MGSIALKSREEKRTLAHACLHTRAYAHALARAKKNWFTPSHPEG